MFTGIVSDIGLIESIEQRGDLQVRIACSYAPESLKPGDSIACNGCCLTVVEKGIGDWGLGIGDWGKKLQSPIPNAHFTVDLSAETLARTAPGQWQPGKRVNLERALRLGDTLDGHMVSGHIDGIATLQEISEAYPLPHRGRVGEGAPHEDHAPQSPPPGLPPTGGGKEAISHILRLAAPPVLSRFIAEKGSVTLDGVSLTVNAVDKNEFSVNIIPHTWSRTTLGSRQPGDALNLEIDLIARYVARLLEK